MLNDVGSERTSAYRSGGVALLIAGAVIVAAFGFQYIGGYAPCPLCLLQRWAYYGGIPALFVAMALLDEKPMVAGLLFLLIAFAFLANAGIGVYHSGVEWKFWPGPETCGTALPLPTSPAELLSDLETQKVIRCDEAAWRLWGISMAGYNAIISLVLFTLTLRAAFLAASSRS